MFQRSNAAYLSRLGVLQVTMQAPRLEPPPSMGHVKDEFLVQCCTVGPDVQEVAADTFDGERNLQQTDLVLVRCCSRCRRSTP